jgi:hypothetical protein
MKMNEGGYFMPTNSDIDSRDLLDIEKKSMTTDEKSHKSEYFSLSLFLLMSSTTEMSMTIETNVVSNGIISMLTPPAPS